MYENLGIIVMNNCKEFGEQVINYIKKDLKIESDIKIPISEVRFSNGEGKVVIDSSVRNKDIYIISDIGNYNCTYKMFGFDNHMGPDEHYQDIKRTICAVRNYAENVTLIMPLLYESRQHRKNGRESLDCSLALQELEQMGIRNFITFDVHDPDLQNAIPMSDLVNLYPTSMVLTDLLQNENLDSELIVVSPDTGAFGRARYYADALNASGFKANVAICHKRRDLTKIVDGKNPIIAHEYIGQDPKGKIAIVTDDLIASGTSMLDVAKELKNRLVEKTYLVTTFPLFTSGLKEFDEANKLGIFEKIYSTNLTYTSDELKERKWFNQSDCSKYLAEVIETLYQKDQLSPTLNESKVLNKTLKKYK